VDFVVKPFKRAVLIEAVERALARRCDEPSADPAQSRPCPEIVGKSRAIRDMLHLVERIAPSSATVLICGESGTGKELVAEAIHRLSLRKNGPLVKVSCAALPETLLESELFGHERGAFTGALEQRRGRFEVADGGTMFLDEITQLSPAMQAKLLRVLQDGRFERLGSSGTLHVSVRVTAATNANLRQAVERGAFRGDLYYRLNVVTIHLPALRERPEDIPLLADHFLRLYRERNGKPELGITREAVDCLTHFSWPGNVRELENAIERAVVLASGDRVTVDELPDWITGLSGSPRGVHIPVGTSVREAERRLIEATLRHTGGDRSAAAGLLGINRRTIYRILDDRAGGSSGGGKDK
jgi:two-component system response regulator HydG